MKRRCFVKNLVGFLAVSGISQFASATTLNVICSNPVVQSVDGEFSQPAGDLKEMNTLRVVVEDDLKNAAVIIKFTTIDFDFSVPLQCQNQRQLVCASATGEEIRFNFTNDSQINKMTLEVVLVKLTPDVKVVYQCSQN